MSDIAKAEGIVARALADARQEGWDAAWTRAETMVMQAESLEVLLRAIHGYAHPEPPGGTHGSS